MSLLWKISTSSDRMLMKNGFLSVGRYYSRRSKSKYSGLLRQLVGRDDSADKTNNQAHIWDDEGGPWELLRQSGNRFYLPGSLGPAWQNSRSIINGVNLDNLIDFESTDSNKLHISVMKCPMLLRNDIRKLFSYSKLAKDITIITLYYPKHTEADYSAKNYVLAARLLCERLKTDDHWADFINPFSGKPFFESHKKLFTVDERFRGFGVKIENQNNCLVISSDMDGMFSGCIFTNAPIELHVLELLCDDTFNPPSVKSLDD